MTIYIKIFLLLTTLFLISCSSSYKKLSSLSENSTNNFSKALFDAYKEKAKFEANIMHDWNSAKLYSEKAIKAYNGKIIFPQKIDYWNIPSKKKYKLRISYNNLLKIYDEAVTKDPINLAKAISSLDCWSEQLEEKWQTWDINKCRDDFLLAMNIIHKSISKNNNNNQKIKNEINSHDKTTLLSKNIKKEVLHLIYFDFDNSKLSNIIKKKLEEFIKNNKKQLNKLIVVGHTDTIGTKEYNQELSLKRALEVKKILIEIGIKREDIQIFGKGENELSIKTPNNISHPANRRAEIIPLN